MKQKSLILLGLLVILLVGAFIFFKIHQSSIPTKQAAAKPAVILKEVTITLSKNGFSPSSLTIKAGTTVRWKNESGSSETVNSDTYPTNQLHKELNFGVFANNSSVVYTFAKPGTYGYHNQFHHEQEGNIIVVQ